MIETERLILRPWTEEDRAFYAALSADPDVMHDYPVLPPRGEVDAKFALYRDHFETHGFGRWLLERKPDGAALGFSGLMPVRDDHPLAPGVEISWRLFKPAWGLGYASEAARAALADGFGRLGFEEIVSYTSPENTRSQAVMRRAGMIRDPGRDYARPERLGGRAIVFVARP